ncbi:CBS domain-containing protein [Bradyrhizobium betae]|uniref:CBS domain-containing protein n=1 Tax=Bradyrhizobium betae TaxID=244734 RepID=A0A5P6P1J2_9BRAD|nr:CBS domain-containing protein [Bradyrhizobium betae]MCS3725341.1 CBS domain-containing protein [Bradyrhizobium betae]QFI71343.1 CBS domain-containing protein [Bradyrhizobium betae]
MIVEAILPAARERLIILSDEAPLIDAARLLRDFEADLVVVHNSDRRLAGVITKTDVVRQISHCQGTSCIAAASTIMTKPVVYCHRDDLLSDVWSVMKEQHLKNVPILDPDSRPIGVLNARDALEALLEELEYEEVLLREYVMCVGYH